MSESPIKEIQEEEPSLLDSPQIRRKPVQKIRKKPNKQRDFFDFSHSSNNIEEIEDSDDSTDLLLKKRRKDIDKEKGKGLSEEEEDDVQIVEIDSSSVFKEIGLELEDEHFSGRISDASRAKLIEAEIESAKLNQQQSIMLSKPPISPEKKIAPVDEIDEEEEEDEDLIGGKDINLNRVSITLKFFEKAGGNVTAKFYSDDSFESIKKKLNSNGAFSKPVKIFKFDGQKLNLQSKPMDHDMEDDDQIDVILE